MQFANADILYWTFALVGLAALLFFGSKARQRGVFLFVEKKLLNDISPFWDRGAVIWKNVLIVTVFLLSIIALARPQWGFEWQEVRREGIDILLIIDTSKSMLAADVKPNRLERTKLAVKDLIQKLNGDRIGLIAFAGDAFLACPLTVDYSGFMLALDDLSTNTIPRGGTNIGEAIKEAIRGYEKDASKYKAIIVVTDGDNLEGDPLLVAKKAKEAGIKIYCVGIGTKDGELIQIRNDKGELEFLKDSSGNFVKSRLNEDLLQQIALTTDAAYVRASGAEFGLDVIYEKELSKLEKRDFKEKKEKKYFERFQIPLGVAIFLLVLETCLNTRKRKVL